MKLQLFKEMTIEELSATISTFLNKWFNNNDITLYIEELKFQFISNGEKYDLVKDGEEAKFNIDVDKIENHNVSPVKYNSQSNIISKKVLINEVTKWMFVLDEEYFSIQPQIKKELEYIGDIDLDSGTFPVFSVEAYCRKRGLLFKKYTDEIIIEKCKARELIPSPFKINTSILLNRNVLREGIALNDLEKYIGQKIFVDVSFPLVTEPAIKNVLPHLEKSSLEGLLYLNFDFVDKSFLNVYNWNDLMEQNNLVHLYEDEYKKNKFSLYISNYELSNFPQNHLIKDHAVICGYRTGNEIDEYNRPIPIYSIDQVLEAYPLINKDQVKETHLCCHVKYLHHLKLTIYKKNGIEYDNVSVIGVTVNRELVFDNIPLHKRNEMIDYLENIKAKE